MMIVMKQDATEEQIQAVIARIEAVGARAHRSPGEEVTVIGAIGDREHVQRLELEGAPGVDKVMPILKPYKLASSQIRHGEPSVFEIGGRKIGGDHFALIAGPCTVESREQVMTTAEVVKAAGATLYRGGAYKPRTSPYAFHGLGEEGLRLLAEAKAETGMPIVTELMDVRDLEPVLEVADVIQVGARNMQNYTLLTELGRDARGVAQRLRVHPQGGQRSGDAVRARHPHVRDRLPLHARPDGGAGAEGAHAPADHRRPLARRRPARPRHAAVARSRRGRGGRDHRRGAPEPGRSHLRRAAADRRRRLPGVRREGGSGRRGCRQGAVRGSRGLSGERSRSCASRSSAWA